MVHRFARAVKIMARFQPPKGMADIGPEEMAQRRWIYDRVRKVSEAWGFREVDPSYAENFETLARKAGADIDKELYTFTDKAGRKLGLRFDITLGLARMIASKNFPMPQKFWTIAPMWRYDNPQYGRYRCFWQWNIEVYGSKNSAADAEVIAASAEVCKGLGLADFEVRINSRKIVEGLFESLGIKGKKAEDAMRVVDKIEKLPRPQILAEFKKAGIEKKDAEKTLEMLAQSGSPETVMKKLDAKIRSPIIKAGLEELRGVVEELRSYKDVLKRCVIDLSIVRGLAYYTGVVFEIYDRANEKVGAIAAGGRYDSLCALYGKDVPAVGAAGGIERLLLALEQNKNIKWPRAAPKVFVVAVDDTTRKGARQLALDLRAAGISADFDIMGRKLSAQMEYAAKLGARFAAIVGKRELAARKFNLKDLESGKQEELKAEEIVKRFAEPNTRKTI